MRAAEACPGCEGEKVESFIVEGLCCATEAALIEERLSALSGVCAVQASPVTGQARVVHTLETGAVERAINEAGFRVRPHAVPPRGVPPAPALLAAGLTVAGAAASTLWPLLSVALYAGAIVSGGIPIARRGLERLRQGSLDMNVLMTLAVLGAMAIGEWLEGASTVVLFSIAQLLESRSVERARKAIGGLMTLAPDTATVERDGQALRVGVTALRRGEHVRVRPGERIPVDGTVLAGWSEVDQSALTGESRPVSRGPGEGVFAGTINGGGALTVQVTRLASETTLARVLRRVEEAQASRAQSQGFVDRFAALYTPAVVVLAVLLAVTPPLFGWGTFEGWLYRSLVLLVIACPCALVISTPVSIVSALTRASRLGVLVKGGGHLEELARVRAVAFAKSGTLTTGEPRVVDVLPAGGQTRGEILRLAAAVEVSAGHLLGEAIVAAARAEGYEPPHADDVSGLPGRGARGRVDGQSVLVGSHRLFDELSLCDYALDADLARLESEGKTVVLVGRDEARELVGVIALADTPRPEAGAVVEELAKRGLVVALLTGDNARTGLALARRLGIEQAFADLLPEDKVGQVRALRTRYGSVAMVGDGVNDAPALAAASVGIAMGQRGTDEALETADVVLMADDLGRIHAVIALGRSMRHVILQNVSFSLAVKALVLGLALAGHGSLWAAVAADMGASLVVIANGLRLLGRSGRAQLSVVSDQLSVTEN
jgi:Cd2+/Zn2+-exporting ATPase